MKKLIAALVVALLVGTSAVTAGQSTPATSIRGVWQTVEVNIGGATPRTLTPPDPKPYYTIFTTRHYSRTEIQNEAPRPIIADASKATADELRATWGPVVAEAGTYEVSGNMLTLHPLASKSPAAMASGAVIVNTFRIEGATLWITQVRNQAGPYASPVTFKLIRIE